jgi:hypothetical protein
VAILDRVALVEAVVLKHLDELGVFFEDSGDVLLVLKHALGRKINIQIGSSSAKIHIQLTFTLLEISKRFRTAIEDSLNMLDTFFFGSTFSVLSSSLILVKRSFIS